MKLFTSREEKKNQAIRDKESLVQMYQSGFLDGYRLGKRTNVKDNKLWVKIYELCRQAFFGRYEQKINKKLKAMRK